MFADIGYVTQWIIQLNDMVSIVYCYTLSYTFFVILTQKVLYADDWQ